MITEKQLCRISQLCLLAMCTALVCNLCDTEILLLLSGCIVLSAPLLETSEEHLLHWRRQPSDCGYITFNFLIICFVGRLFITYYKDESLSLPL